MQPVVSASNSSLDAAAACVDSPHPFRVAVVDVEAVGGHDTARTIGQRLSTDLRLAGRIALVMVTCQINAQLEAKAKWAGFAQVRTFEPAWKPLLVSTRMTSVLHHGVPKDRRVQVGVCNVGGVCLAVHRG
jgi:hypothetical protein